MASSSPVPYKYFNTYRNLLDDFSIYVLGMLSGGEKNTNVQQLHVG
jgi:hypothetical protein